LKPAFTFLHACRFAAVHEREQLLLDPQQLCAGLAESPIGVGQFANFGEFVQWRADVLRPALAAVGEDGAGVKLSLRAVASGFSTAAAEGVERAGQERFTAQEDLDEFLELWGDGEELEAEGAEIASHGWSPGW